MAAIKNVKHVYYLLLWMHLRILNQNLWNKRGVKNMTIRHTSRRAVAPTVVQSSDSKGQLPLEVRWLFCRLLYSTVVGLHDIAGDVYHQSIITFPAPVSGIDIHIGSEYRCFSLETSNIDIISAVLAESAEL